MNNFDFLNKNLYYISKYNIVYIATPKVACTSLKWWVADLTGVASEIACIGNSKESSQELKIHDVFYKLSRNITGLDESSIRQLLRDESEYKFALVRNPFKRIFSAWQSKILLREPIQIERYGNEGFCNFRIEDKNSLKLNFELFIQYLYKFEMGNFKDYHWTPQFELLQPENIAYNRISKIEDCSQLQREVMSRLPEGSPDPFEMPRSNESLIGYDPFYFSKHTQEMICELYADDFRYFEYSQELPLARSVQSESELSVAISAIKMLTSAHDRFFEQISFDAKEKTEIQAAFHGLKQSFSQIEMQLKKKSVSYLFFLGGYKLLKKITRAWRSRKRLIEKPKLKWVGDIAKLDHAKPTVLLVTHEASFTGAPILSANMLELLKNDFNVVSFCLKYGALQAVFDQVADISIVPNDKYNSVNVKIIEKILKRINIDFAILNSVVTAGIAAYLSSYAIPNILLVHEFASYINPKKLFVDGLRSSGKTVFSSNLVRNDFLRHFPQFENISALVIPQGKSHVPHIFDVSTSQRNEELSKIQAVFSSESGRTKFIIGAGAVQIRKGVDFFIRTAAQVLRNSPTLDVKFIWVGDGYDPLNDLNYSAYLEDEIFRFGLQEKISFLGSVQQIEQVYKLADCMLVTSRLDPLPNVAIDAMQASLPVLCFDKTSGICDFYHEIGVADHLIAEYMNPVSMSKKLLKIISDRKLADSLVKAVSVEAFSRFDMGSYVNSLVRLLEEQGECIKNVESDFNFLYSSNKVDYDFSRPKTQSYKSDADYLRVLLKPNSVLLGERKPVPGFHPGVYRALVPDINVGEYSYAHYLRSGEMKGPWVRQVITPSTEIKSFDVESIHVALHLHVHYTEGIELIIDSLNKNAVKPDLYISTNDELSLQFILEKLEAYHGLVGAVEIVPNRGRDIGPLITHFGERLISKYHFVGHFHIKKSIGLPNRHEVEDWARFLEVNLIGGEYRMLDRILGFLVSSPDVGLVFPDDPSVVGWTKNLQAANMVKESLSIQGELPRAFNFPVGNMYWLKIDVLRKLLELNLGWDDYPVEPLQYDGTFLHAIERMMPFIAESVGLTFAVTNVPGISR